MFERLSIQGWRQFETVDIVFHPRLTVLTGANGTGKTTILQLLNRHWGWNLKYLPSPEFDEPGSREYRSGFWGNDSANAAATPFAPRPQYDIGAIHYTQGRSSRIRVPQSVSQLFDVELDNQPQILGVFVPSHRPHYVFQQIKDIPTKLDAKEHIFEVYLNEVKGRYTGKSMSNFSPATQIKRALISLAMFGYGNQVVERDEDAIRTFEGFEEILRKTLPEALGFKRIRIKMPDVLLDTESGVFSLEAVSGGVAAIIDMTWQIYMYSLIHESFVVVIDEPEAHLHPALQKRLLPDLLEAFPTAQFVIATHNPFMVTSVRNSNVFVLKYNEHHRVESTLLDTLNKASTADEILMDVLGVPSTLPDWVKVKIEALLEEFIKRPITTETVSELKTQLTTMGAGQLFPEVLARVAEGHR